MKKSYKNTVSLYPVGLCTDHLRSNWLFASIGCL